MKTIRHTAILCYYDGVQVFEAQDRIGGRYLAVLVESDEKGNRFVVVGINPDRLREFRVGTIDLRSVLLEQGKEEWFIGTVGGSPEEAIPLELQTGSLEETAHLPDPDFVLHEATVTSDMVVREARARNNVVIELALEPPESAQGHRIRVPTLSGALNLVQTVLKHAYGMAMKAMSPQARNGIDKTDAYLLDVVVPAAQGSFMIVLEAARQPDLFGHAEISRALAKLDELTEQPDDPMKTLDRLRQNQGHLAAAFIRLLEFLLKSKSSLRYSWATPQSPKAVGRRISEAQAGPLVETLSKAENLAVETVTFVGPLRKVDVDAGTWRLGAQGEEGEQSGKVKQGGPSLSHLETDRVYRFTCEEVLEEITGTGREVRTLYLLKYEQLN